MAKKVEGPVEEAAQIGLGFVNGQTNMVLRFSTEKRGRAEYNSLLAAWHTYHSKLGKAPRLHDVPADMFVASVDLDRIVSISYLEHAVRENFKPK